MSVRKPPHKLQIELSLRAERDFRHILNYTKGKWGERQVVIYRDQIHHALQTIVENPLKGKLLDKGIRKIAAQKHNIFYRDNGQNIIVLRILHERMDEARHAGM